MDQACSEPMTSHVTPSHELGGLVGIRQTAAASGGPRADVMVAILKYDVIP